MVTRSRCAGAAVRKRRRGGAVAPVKRGVSVRAGLPRQARYATSRGESRVLRLRRSDGQALVEFAIVVPLVLLLLYGIIDFSSAYSYKNNMEQLANEAARYAAVNTCGTTACAGGLITSQVKNDAETGDLKNGGGSISSPGVAVTLCFPTASSNVGDPIQSNVDATYKWLPALVSALGIPQTVGIHASATERLEVAYNPVVPGPAGPISRC
jgi:TadE-like protein